MFRLKIRICARQFLPPSRATFFHRVSTCCGEYCIRNDLYPIVTNVFAKAKFWVVLWKYCRFREFQNKFFFFAKYSKIS